MLGKLVAGTLLVAGIGGLSTAASAQSYGGITLSFGSGGYSYPYGDGYSYPYAYDTYGWEPYSYYGERADDDDDYGRFGYWAQQREIERDRWDRARREYWEHRRDRRWHRDDDDR